MADANSLRQRLSPLVDQITEDVQLIESSKFFRNSVKSYFQLFCFQARNLSSKHRLEISIDEATKLVCVNIRFFFFKTNFRLRLVILNVSIPVMDVNIDNVLLQFVNV